MIKKNKKRVIVAIDKNIANNFLRSFPRSTTRIIELTLNYCAQSEEFYNWLMFGNFCKKFRMDDKEFLKTKLAKESAKKGREYLRNLSGKTDKNK